jgi:predicted RNA-binding Zn-ribbon protein involved in translation (DUF1610 family)
MSDFITLACPSCGGRLDVAPGASTLVCKHCGGEHMVRREAGAVLLEAFARCPACGRNDRVEKVSAIIDSQTQTAHEVVQRTEVVVQGGQQRLITRDVPVARKQASVLAQRLAPPEPPVAPAPTPQAAARQGRSRLGGWAILLGLAWGAVSLVCGLGPLLFDGGPDAESAALIGILSTLGCALPLVGGGILLALLGRRGQHSAAQARARQRAEEEARAAGREARYARARARWEQLYYCYRDGCVFIPSEGDSAPLAEMRAYLYRR